ncbi:MAG TPA: hypothetical protein VGH97_00395 [Thermoanaerobaculia bacterium]|jgi:hypothetical protein
MASNPKLLDRLILADLALAVASIVTSSASPAQRPHGAAFLLWLGVCAATVLAWIGLAWRYRPARVVYAAAWLGYLALVALRAGGAASTASPFDGVLDLATGLVGGMILAVSFFSDALAPARPRVTVQA